MSLGTLAVGIVIFAIVAVLLGVAIKCLAEDADTNGMALWIVTIVCLYCAISGTYLLHLAGKIRKENYDIYYHCSRSRSII